MSIPESILIAVSLCADCFAVSLCSAVSIKKVRGKDIAAQALAFAIIQTGFLLAGWGIGEAVMGLLGKLARILGILLLGYVSVSMIMEGIKGDGQSRDLRGWRNIIIGGIATSIDALSVGASLSFTGSTFAGIVPLSISLFAVTALSVVAGIAGGHRIGKAAGRWAVLGGGIILAIIALNILFEFV